MKRMNVREFRAKISELDQEPIEVIRYSETVGFWVPIAMTTEPKKRRVSGTSTAALKAKSLPRVSAKGALTAEEIDDWLAKLKKYNEAIRKMTVK